MTTRTQKTKNKRRIYLDYASSAPMDPEVAKVVQKVSSTTYGNPSALHKEGILAKKVIEDARTSCAQFFGVHSDEILFTGSGTESDNLAISGVLEAFLIEREDVTTKPHIIVSAIEHSAVLEPVKYLHSMGIDVSYIPVSQEGIIDMKEFKKLLRKETVLVSVMYANNEIGTIEPVREIAKTIRHWKKVHAPHSSYPLFHTDATQAIQFLSTHIPELGVDLLSCNGSKIYGPKGIGMLYKKRGTPFRPMMKGGMQEFGLRPGTENTPLIAGFARALEIIAKKKDKEGKRLQALKEWLISHLDSKIPNVIWNGSEEDSLPHIINMTIPGIESDFLVISLDSKGFALSSKSACKEGDEGMSHVIMNLKKDIRATDGSLRISMGRDTTKKDLESFTKALIEVIDLHNKALTFLKEDR